MRERRNFGTNDVFKSENFGEESMVIVEKSVAIAIQKRKNFVAEPLIIRL